MSRKKSVFKIVSIILSVLLLLTALPLGVSAADTQTVTPDVKIENVTSEKTSPIPVRVPEEEGESLNTIVMDNGDGTHTLTLYNHPVKFVDDEGKVQDISLELLSVSNGSYKTKANTIQTVFPKNISDGISLSGEGVNIKLKPTVPSISLQVTSKAADDKQFEADTTVKKLDSETVSYYYDNKTTLEYSLTYTGFKEDIVVSEYTGQTEYTFLLETGGLILTKIDESYYLTNVKGEIKATLGDIIIFTADERNNTLGSMSHVTVKENQQYLITIHIDADYLKDEKTVYPIRIDPTIEISYDNNGSGAIQDVTLNQNSGSSGSSGSIYVGKRSSTYGISRTLMKFPGLNLSTISSASNIQSAHVQIRDMLCETTSMTVYGYIFAGNTWSESTANWSNTSPDFWTEMPNAFAEVSYSVGNALNPKHRYSINITQAVKSWKTGFYDQAKGIMLRADDNVEYGSSTLYKTFASYNRASNKPSLVVNYESQTAIDIVEFLESSKNMMIGDTYFPEYTTEPSNVNDYNVVWSTTNNSVATVSTSGCITAINPGEATINININDGEAVDSIFVSVYGPPHFGEYISDGIISNYQVKHTEDNFFTITKSIADILLEKNVYVLYDMYNEPYNVVNYFDDWFIYAVPDNYYENDYVYGLYKLREQESDHIDMDGDDDLDGDNDDPGVTISLIMFDIELLNNLLNSNTNDNSVSLYNEIDRVVYKLGQTASPFLKDYFANPAAKAPYYIAELYVKHVLQTATNSKINVPSKFLSNINSNPEGRLAEAIAENNTASNQIIYNIDDNCIYFNNVYNPTIYEKYAILITHTANVTFNSFAAEVCYHADALDNILESTFVYDLAIRADMAVGEEEESGVFDGYYDLNGELVAEQIYYHGEY